jgi:hypothetical protein
MLVSGQSTPTRLAKAACLSDAVPNSSEDVMDEGSFKAAKEANMRDEQQPSK